MKGRFLLMSLLLLPFLVLTQPHEGAASAERQAIVRAVDGETSYQKGGSFREISLQQQDHLNPGDLIRTGKDGSIELYMQGTGDTFYVGESSEVIFSYDENNLTVNVLKGNMYVAAEKRESDQEALYIEAEGQEFKVLGTHFTVGFDLLTGESTLFVVSGIVEARGSMEAISNSLPTLIYPTQQFSPLGQDTNVTIIDPDSFVNQTDPAIIKALLLNHAEADRERQEFLENLKKTADEGQEWPIPLELSSIDNLPNLENNLNSLTNVLLNRAIKNETISEEEVQKIIKESTASGKLPIDLDDPSKGILRLTEQQEKQLELQKQNEELVRKKHQQKIDMQKQQQQQFQDTIEQMKKALEQLEQQNQQKLQEAAERALKKFEDSRPPLPPKPSPTIPSPTVPTLPTLPGAIEVMKTKTTSTSITISWTLNNPTGQYEVWLKNSDGIVIAEPIMTSETEYTFTSLSPDSSFTAVVKSGNRMSEVEARTYKLINLSASMDGGFLYVHINNYDEQADYELWLNGNKMEILVDSGGSYKIESSSLDPRENTIEVYSYVNGEQDGYGSHRIEELKIIDVNSTYAIISSTLEVSDGDSYYLNVKGENEANFIVIPYTSTPMILPNLTPNTEYQVIPSLNGVDGETLSFTTSSIGDIQFDPYTSTASWSEPAGNEGKELTYKAFINGVEREISVEPGNELSLARFMDSQVDIKIEIYDGELKIQDYETTVYVPFQLF